MVDLWLTLGIKGVELELKQPRGARTMKDIETIEGYIGIIDRKKSSRNGNPRFMVSISNGKVGEEYECVLAYTMPDSSLGYTVQNFKQGQRVRADVGVHRGTVSLANLEHAE